VYQRLPWLSDSLPKALNLSERLLAIGFDCRSEVLFFLRVEALVRINTL
jgi:hypothetical protein